MSILNIKPQDFIGSLCIAVNVHTEADLQSYIDEYEELYLQDMLGCDLFNLFKADLDAQGQPQTQRFIDIYNSFCIDDDCGQRRSQGILVMVKKFIYWEYVREQLVKNTPSGNKKNTTEASETAEYTESKVYKVYNEGINSYCNIQWYICDNLSTYPEFKGIVKEKTSWL